MAHRWTAVGPLNGGTVRRKSVEEAALLDARDCGTQKMQFLRSLKVTCFPKILFRW